MLVEDADQCFDCAGLHERVDLLLVDTEALEGSSAAGEDGGGVDVGVDRQLLRWLRR